MKLKKQTVVLLFFAGLILLTLIPYSTTSVPEWPVHLAYADGHPAVNTSVRQEWRHNGTLGLQSETRVSDEGGNVIFPERRLFAPLILRVAFRLLDIISYFVMMHGSWVGVHARIVSDEGPYHQLNYKEDGEQENTLIIRRFLE